MQRDDRYERIPFEDSTLPIRINFDTHLTPLDTSSVHQFSWHEQIELLYFHRGNATVYCGDRTLTARDGDVILINPYEIHRLSYDSGSPEYDCLMIDAALYRDPRQGVCETRYFDLLAGGHIHFENHIPPDTDAVDHIRALCAELREKPFAYELSVKARVFALFTCLFRSHIYSDTPLQQLVQNMERYDRIKPALDYMQAHLSEHISLDALARACNVSSAHFCRLFRQITGTTPVQYLNNLRLHEAAVLLKKSDKSVAQIAEAVGFDDVGYLSRRFKSKFGLTPIQVKKHGLGD